MGKGRRQETTHPRAPTVEGRAVSFDLDMGTHQTRGQGDRGTGGQGDGETGGHGDTGMEAFNF